MSSEMRAQGNTPPVHRSMQALLAVGLAGLLASPAAAAEHRFRIGAGSEVAYEAHARVLLLAPERIVGRNSRVTGTALWQDGRPGTGSAEVAIDASGFKSGIRSRDANVRDILDVDDFPRITFHLQAIEGLPEAPSSTASAVVRGVLNAHGRSRALTVPVVVRVAAPVGDVTVDGDCHVRYGDFGLEPPVLGFLLKRADDDLVLRFHLVAHAVP